MAFTEVPTSTLKPTAARVNPVDWMRRNLFNGWLNSLISLVLLWIVPSLLFQLLRWIFTEAAWTPVVANLRLLWVGRYPADQIWRVQMAVTLLALLFGLSAGLWRGLMRSIAIGLAGALLVLALIPWGLQAQAWLGGTALALVLGYGAGLQLPVLRRPALILWLLSPIVVLLLLSGIRGWSALPLVTTDLWGGLLLTILLAVIGILASFPLGILLALGRRSKLPVVKGFCIGYIELIRGVPLVTVLFMAMVMLPLFLPANVRVDNFIRVCVAITLFSAAYLAENIRGGLQAVPKGQEEAAKALGLNVFQTTFLIVLPQALRAVIPAIVGQFISLFKDTSLVSIVGLAELLGIAKIVINQPDWLTIAGGVEIEVLLFTAFVYWVFCFAMAKISRRIEATLGVGTR